MSAIRYESILAAIQRANELTDYYDNYNDLDTQHEFQKQTVLADKSLTENEKTEAIRELNKIYDRNKVLHNEGIKRTCENCKQECLATLYCEYCVRNYLKGNFPNWTSGNDDVDDLIQKYQMESFRPDNIVEWIPYNNLQNINYLTKGGFSEIYTATWIDGKYEEWDSKTIKLKRFGDIEVILKGLENVENATQSWLEEAKAHLTISNKWPQFVQCFGLTQNPSNGNFKLVMYKMDMDLRNYLQQTHNQLTWKERIKIAYDISLAISIIHSEKAIHRDLHSGNILNLQLNQKWYISDFGFWEPADRPTKSIYGNLPYIAPEVLTGQGYIFASDIYSFAMLMWEISSGEPPFINYKYGDFNLVMDIINGIRPKIVSGTPLKYANLMKKCWGADSASRPDISTLIGEILDMYENKLDELPQPPQPNAKNKMETTNSRLSTSKIHHFENLPEPRNAIEEEQEAFHSKLYDFNIPDNIDDFNQTNTRYDKNTSKINSIFKDSSKRLSKVFKKLQINSKNEANLRSEDQDDIFIEANLHSEDQDDILIEANLHSEDQDEFEIPDDGF